MSSYIAQPGVPLLTFGAVDGGKATVEQSRFYLSRTTKAEGEQAWTIPVCLKTTKGAKCELLTDAKSQSLTVPKEKFLFANAGAKGYYRTLYTPEEYKQLVGEVETKLTPPERILMLGNQWALMRSDRATVAQYLDLVKAISSDMDSQVISSALNSVSTVETRIADDKQRDELRAWVRTNFRSLYDNIKTPSPSDTPDRKELRATLFATLVSAKDPAAVAEAKAAAEKYLTDPTSIDPTFGQTALALAARNGDAAYYEQLKKLAETSPDPQIGTRSLYLLAQFNDLALAKQTLEYAVSGKVKNQDSFILLLIEMQIPETRQQAWDFIRNNWDKVQAQLTTASGGAIVGSVGSFCDAAHRDEAVAFFKEHKVPSADRALPRAINSINDCIDLHEAQNASLQQWLKANAK
jgi:aminopeptidase N/puromycin-sensitive aminopeptidase